MKLKDGIRTKEVVQSSYDELSTVLEEKTESHKETMADLYTGITDYKKESAAMTEQVQHFESGHN